MIAVVKADAYGHGALPVVRALRDAGCRRFAVVTLEEAAVLRDDGVEVPILVLGGVHDPDEAALAAARRLTPVVHHPRQLPWLAMGGYALVTCGAVAVGRSAVNKWSYGLVPHYLTVSTYLLLAGVVLLAVLVADLRARSRHPALREGLPRLAAAGLGALLAFQALQWGDRRRGDARVALSDGRDFGRGGDGFVRLNFATSRAILTEVLERMEAALARG